MTLISIVPPENAKGVVKQGYDMFMKNIGMIPKPMEMLSASPGLFESQLERIRYFGKHPTLSFALLLHIRYMASCMLNYGFCQDFNKRLLKKIGLTDPDIRTLETDPSKALLEKHEKAMLNFVLKSMKSPNLIGKQDIKTLRNFGWNDRDMIDALSQGVNMIDHSIMMQVFQIDKECTGPATMSQWFWQNRLL